MPTGLERTVTGEQPRPLPVAATGTALSPAFTTPIATLTSLRARFHTFGRAMNFKTTHLKGTT